MNHVMDIPNKAGFRLIGIDHDGERHVCVVELTKYDMYSIYRESDHEPFFMQLQGWESLKGENG